MSFFIPFILAFTFRQPNHIIFLPIGFLSLDFEIACREDGDGRPLGHATLSAAP
jgi:hypothetical protein